MPPTLVKTLRTSPWQEETLPSHNGFYQRGWFTDGISVVATEHNPRHNIVVTNRYIQIDGKPSNSLICKVIDELFKPAHEQLGEHLELHAIVSCDRIYVTTIWDETTCLDYEETAEICYLLGLDIVRVFYRGPFDLTKIEDAYETQCGTQNYVIRPLGKFNVDEFSTKVGAWICSPE